MAPKSKEKVKSSKSLISDIRNKQLDKVEAKELHKPVRKNFQRRPVEVAGIDDTWAADLVDMKKFSKENSGYKWMLTVIDVLSRYAWAVPMKDKKAKTVLDAMEKIITQSGRTPKKIWCDQGAEFLNKEFKANFKDVYHTYSYFHAAPIERFNRTLKTIMWYKMTKHDTKEWVSRLPKLLRKYNNREHSSIKMTPTEASKKENEERLLDLQEQKVERIPNRKPKFKVGDVVRISIQKKDFQKGYTPGWSFDLYRIDEVLPTRPPTYKIRDIQADDEITGAFYEQELQKSAIRWSLDKKTYYVAED